jgi:hypothetical protein
VTPTSSLAFTGAGWATWLLAAVGALLLLFGAIVTRAARRTA